MSGSILAAAVFLIGVAATLLWFGVSRRREAEVEIGVQSLANMKWRDSIAVVLEALQRDGFEQKTDRTRAAAGEGRGGDMLLAHADGKVLLAYKHGTAYRLGEANVHEFADAMQKRGAHQGILLTLGSTEPGAEEVARTAGVQLLDGRSLWLKVRQFLPPETLKHVQGQAAARTRKGLLSGVTVSFLAAVAAYLIGNLLLNPGSEAPAPSPASGLTNQTAAAEAARKPGPSDPMLNQLNATAKAMAEVAKLSNAELATRRAQAAKAIALMPQVNTAAWSGQSRLLVTLDRSDGKDKVLIDEMCRQLTQYEELRYTRIQMEPPPGSDLPVRWRLCD